ncbi:O-antigen polysaccharide polymerase Wzy [Sporosarcina sp. Marseille-Q4063]|uniref:O-antigen polysaccharide polymerase Wzy n=1 Tax=Sporosarcina sp. Marseille-Q4063 TaxID=2810514 RepID=UPI001BAF5E79|nr:O-antigen polysaccharide polymerase Wzy [Sporosarcina sp. Marseille-Q4063]QUW21249.1 O-antigen polysaccharide polymerase Wzy [Sporosarcina sp. Marseille-Q4063]
MAPFSLKLLTFTLILTILITLPDSTLSFLFPVSFAISVIYALRYLYNEKWLYSLVLVFYITPFIYLFFPEDYLGQLYPLEYLFGFVKSNQEELKSLFTVGSLSLLNLLTLFGSSESGKIFINTNYIKSISKINSNILGIIGTLLLFLALPLTNNLAIIGGYVDSLNSTGAGVFLILSSALLVFNFTNAKYKALPLIYLLIFFAWGLLNGRRVEQLGILILLAYYFCRKYLLNESKKLNWYIAVTVLIALVPIVNIIFNFWGYYRIGEEFDWGRLTITTAPGIIYAIASTISLQKFGVSPDGDFFGNYILRFFGVPLEDFSSWVQEVNFTLGGMHIIAEPFMYYGTLGAILSSVILFLFMRFAEAADRIYKLILFTPVLIIMIPRYIWYGHIYALRTFQVFILLIAIIESYKFIRKIQKRGAL